MKTKTNGGGGAASDAGDELDVAMLDIFGGTAAASDEGDEDEGDEADDDPEGDEEDDDDGDGSDDEDEPKSTAKARKGKAGAARGKARRSSDGADGDDEEVLAEKLLRGLGKLRARRERDAEAARARPSIADKRLREELSEEIRTQTGQSNRTTNLILARMLRQEIKSRMPAEAQPEHHQAVFNAAVGLSKSGLFKDEDSLIAAAMNHAKVHEIGESRTPRTSTSTPDTGGGSGPVKRALSRNDHMRKLFDARERGASQAEIDAIARLPRTTIVRPRVSRN